MSDATRWVGIDLHRRRSHIAIVDEHGELTTSRRIVNDRETFLELLGDPGDGQAHVALEATYGWEWLAELLEEAGYDLHLAHRLRTRAIAAARIKTDAIDGAPWRSCCAPGCSRRPASRRARSATCASCCVTARR
jgi:transposase